MPLRTVHFPRAKFTADPDEVVQLSAAVDGDWGVLDGAPPDARVLRFVEDWGEYYLERPIRSLRLLD